jgi:DNA-directed RNA polymerase subunit RPC12/RpoP
MGSSLAASPFPRWYGWALSMNARCGCGIPPIFVPRCFLEEQAWLDLESLLWPNGPVCPHCGVINHDYCLKPKNGQRTTRAVNVSYRRLWKCADCWKKFSVIKGTIFEDTHLPLATCLIATFLFNASKNGVAAYELHTSRSFTCIATLESLTGGTRLASSRTVTEQRP